MEQRKIILWSVALFFGCSLVFGGIDRLVGEESRGTSLAIQVCVLIAIVGTIVLLARRKKP